MMKIFFKHFMYAFVFVVSLAWIGVAGYEIGYWIMETYPNSPLAWLVVPFVCALVGTTVYAYEATKTELRYSK